MDLMTLSWIRTACSRDCPDGCSLLVGLREGKIWGIKGDPGHPITKGFLCARTGRFPDRLVAKSRILSPLLRRGGEFVEVSWDDALGRIAEELKDCLDFWGPKEVAFYCGGGSLGILMGLTKRLFRLLGPVTECVGDICGGAGDEAQIQDFGINESSDFFDLRQSKNIILWGKNPGVANIHLLPLLKERVRAGAGLFSVNPVPPASGLPAFEAIVPRPGRDLELALGVGRLLLESAGGREGKAPEGWAMRFDGLEGYMECAFRETVSGWAAQAGVSRGEVEALAQALLDQPCALLIGWGLQRRQRGGATVRALDALSALSGNLGIPGGGASYNFGRRSAFRKDLAPKRDTHSKDLRLPLLGRDLAASPPRFFWISAANPVAMLPDSASVARGLEKVPFLVVVDSHETDTTRRADVVLPVATMLETEDVCGAYGHHWVQKMVPVIPPMGEAKTELEILQSLAARLGLENEMSGSAREWIDRFLREDVKAQGLSLQTLDQGPVRNPLAPEILFKNGCFPTSSGRPQLPTLYPPPPKGDTHFPLALFSNSHRKSQSSQWVGEESEFGPLEARVHPSSAEGWEHGATVALVSSVGRLRVKLVFDSSLQEGIVCVPKGGSLDLGRAANVLVPAVETDLGGGAAYLDTWVRIERFE